MQTVPVRSLLALAAALLAALAMAPAASAASSLDSMFQDDAVLLNDSPDQARASLDELSGLGVRTIHSLVVWAQVAPERGATKRPEGFDPTDPASYPADNWKKYDNLVREATTRGLSVLFTPTLPAPAWAGDCETEARKLLCLHKPSAKQYGAFMEALGKRYSGLYPDPERPGSALPAVRRWSLLNEPNLGAWLQPQYARVRGKVVPTGARIARNLIYAGIDALRANGHPDDPIYIAETAPVGSTTGKLVTRKNPPRSFLRALYCLDSRGRALVDSRIGCRQSFRRLDVTGIAHHPYTLGAGGPPFARSGKNDITIGFLSRLTGLVNQAAARGRIPSSAARRIYFTEFGYQTDPPDDNFGVSWMKQAEYINQGDYIAYRTRQVRGVSQYELFDDPSKASFNSGLRVCRQGGACAGDKEAGAKKTSYDAYRLPIYVTIVRKRRTRVRVFGWVRPALSAQKVELYVITRNADGDGEKQRLVRTVTTRSSGMFDIVVARAKGAPKYQLRWKSGASTYKSRKARVALR
jgi:hypothetical protein